jgi:ADP-ribose pyrophosphatase
MTTPLADGDVPHLTETEVESTEAWRGKFLRVNFDQVRLPDGRIASREYLLHPGAVMVVPMFDDGRVVLERQYRYPVRKTFIEFPAGKIDPGEDPLVCGQRELLEETGYVASRWDRLGEIHNAIGYSNERIELWLARGLELKERKLDEGEFLDVFIAPLSELLDAIHAGRVTDVKTIVGAYWAERI